MTERQYRTIKYAVLDVALLTIGLALLALVGCGTDPGTGAGTDPLPPVTAPLPPVTAPLPPVTPPPATTCQERFEYADLAVSQVGARLAFAAAPGLYHLAAYTPPGNGAGRLIAAATGQSGPLELTFAGLCGDMPVQVDYGCGTPPPGAGYNGGSFGGHQNIVLHGQPCPSPTPTPPACDLGRVKLEANVDGDVACFDYSWLPPPATGGLTDSAIPLHSALVTTPGHTCFVYAAPGEYFGFLRLTHATITCEKRVDFTIRPAE